MTRALGVAHLTLLSLTPPEVVMTAAEAGFDFVGLRVRAVTASERAYPMLPGSPMLAETISRLHDTGIFVKDIEFLPLTADTTSDDWLPALESGAALGASALTVTGADPDRDRLLETLTRLSADAADFGIRPVLEPISYQPVSRVEDAADLARRAGAALMLDALHLQRGGSTLAEVRALETDLVPVIQLCDGPRVLAVPDDAERIEYLQAEARVQREIIGRGEFPLAELLAAAAPETPVSVEIPHRVLQSTLTPLQYARLNAQAARELIDSVDRIDAGRTDRTGGPS